MANITLMITVGNTVFTKSCETASEAFDAWRDAWTGLYKEALTYEKMDEMMDNLIRMKKGVLTRTEHRQIRIIYEESKED